MNELCLLILKTLDGSGQYQMPENLLFLSCSRKVRPQATRPQWDEVILDLTVRELIGFTRDEIDDEKKFFIREKGQTALRR